jgi:hypothetical protein
VDENRVVLVVLDNAHAPPAEDLCAVVRGMAALRFVLLAHPGATAAEVAARLQIEPEGLKGWSTDTVAAEAAAASCAADPAACDALLALTGGLPLYIQNAIATAVAAHGGDLGKFCAELAARTHSVETAQELILKRVVETLPAETRQVLGVLSVCDVPLHRTELIETLERALDIGAAGAASHLRRLRTAGALEVFGGDRLKVHDAVRLPGRAELDAFNARARATAWRSLRETLQRSVRADWEYPKVKLLLRVLAETGDAKTLVELGRDELFHEMGLWPDIEARLNTLADASDVDPETRFWALDGWVLNFIRAGSPDAFTRLQQMRRLVDENSLGPEEQLAVGMKEMMLFCQSARKVDPRLEWAPRGGQIEFRELTVAAGLSEDEGPWHDTDLTALPSSARSRRSSSPARRCTDWRSVTTCHGT